MTLMTMPCRWRAVGINGVDTVAETSAISACQASAPAGAPTANVGDPATLATLSFCINTKLNANGILVVPYKTANLAFAGDTMASEQLDTTASLTVVAFV